MVIFFIIKRTMWDRYLQVVIVKLDAINAALPFTGVAHRQRAGLITPRLTGSTPVVGILLSQVYKNLPRCQYSNNLVTGMAQRERAGLITPRSLDQSQLPVFYIRRFTRTYHAVNTATNHTSPAWRRG